MPEIEQISINVLPTHKDALRALAEQEGESMSVIMRRLIRQEAVLRRIWPCRDDNAESSIEQNGLAVAVRDA